MDILFKKNQASLGRGERERVRSIFNTENSNLENREFSSKKNLYIPQKFFPSINV